MIPKPMTCAGCGTTNVGEARFEPSHTISLARGFVRARSWGTLLQPPGPFVYWLCNACLLTQPELVWSEDGSLKEVRLG